MAMRPGFIFLALMALVALAAGPATAQPGRPGVLPLDRILPDVRRAYPGEFYDADGPTPGPDGEEHYHLKWMTPDGRIMWLDTDARTGRVLGQAPGRDSFDAPGRGRNFAPAPSYPIPEREDRGFGRRELDRGGDRGGDRAGGRADDRQGDRGGDRGAGPFRGGGRDGYGGGNGRGRRDR
jgi:hypothetical protein